MRAIDHSTSSVTLSAAVGLLFLATLACAPPAPVIQGKVVVQDIVANRLVVQDETRLDSAPVILDTSTARMGRRPRVGEIVRVAYRFSGGTNRALAVMNVGVDASRGHR